MSNNEYARLSNDLLAQRVALFLNPFEGWRYLVEAGAKPWQTVVAIKSVSAAEDSEPALDNVQEATFGKPALQTTEGFAEISTRTSQTLVDQDGERAAA